MNNQILDLKNIKLNCTSTTSDEAIVAIGNVLLEAGNIEEEYIQGMLNRDHNVTTYIGNHIAIPHGEYEVKKYVKNTSLAVMIYPDGIDWHGEVAKVVIGIASQGEEHMEILSNIAMKLCEIETVEEVVNASDVESVYKILTEE